MIVISEKNLILIWVSSVHCLVMCVFIWFGMVLNNGTSCSFTFHEMIFTHNWTLISGTSGKCMCHQETQISHIYWMKSKEYRQNYTNYWMAFDENSLIHWIVLRSMANIPTGRHQSHCEIMHIFRFRWITNKLPKFFKKYFTPFKKLPTFRLSHSTCHRILPPQLW